MEASSHSAQRNQNNALLTLYAAKEGFAGGFAAQ